MKKLLVALALLTVSTVGYAKEVVSNEKYGGLWIIDGKKVYLCDYGYQGGCGLVSSDYRKSRNEDPYFEESEYKGIYQRKRK